MSLKIKGRLVLKSNNSTIFEKDNAITTDALELIMRSLTKVPNDVNIDKVKATGDYGTEEFTITDSIYDSGNGSITFITLIPPNKCVGQTTSLQLGSSLMDLYFSEKLGLDINKDEITQIEVRWTIQITNN